MSKSFACIEAVHYGHVQIKDYHIKLLNKRGSLCFKVSLKCINAISQLYK